MAEVKPGVAPLTAEDLAADLERKQSQRLITSGIVSVVVNVLFLVGAASGMAEKPLTIVDENPSYVDIITLPSPAQSPAAAATPAPTPTPATRVAQQKRNPERPRERQKPRQVATVKPKILTAPTIPRRPTVRPTPPPPPDEVQPKPEETPPPTKSVETSVARNQAQQANAARGRSEETRAANRNTNSELATAEQNSSTAARLGNDGQVGRLNGGVSGGRGGESGSGGAANRLGLDNGSNAPGRSGLAGVTRDTGSLNGATGSVPGPKLSASTGPTLGNASGPAGARNTILMADVGGTSDGEFTVAQGSGLRPGAIVSRQGSPAGGAPGVKSTATLAPRIAGNGIGGGGGGAEALGSTYKPSTGPGGGGRGPTGFGGIGGPGARGGDGPLGGSAGGDPGGIFAGGRGTGVGSGGGRGTGRTSGLAGAGNGNGGSGGTRAGNGGNGTGAGGPGRSNGIAGNGKGPGSGEGGPTGSVNGIGVGTGAGNKPGVLGVKNGATNGKGDVGNGTGTAGSIGRAEVAVRGTGGGGADIQTSKIGVVEGKGNDRVQVNTDGKKADRTTGGAEAGTSLTPAIDTSSRIEAKTEARAISRPKPVITEEMLASNPKRVRVRFNIAPNGSSTCEKISGSGNSEVDDAVMKACRGYRWSPATSGGKPVPSQQEISFDPKDFR